mmetsp:Transcript_114791/g.366129  ORF Transcript_114791/g.366129 Transcript_114791/m.366129 type:complete len:519 (+) Transcript_114791:1-1557(+)
MHSDSQLLSAPPANRSATLSLRRDWRRSYPQPASLHLAKGNNKATTVLRIMHAELQLVPQDRLHHRLQDRNLPLAVQALANEDREMRTPPTQRVLKPLHHAGPGDVLLHPVQVQDLLLLPLPWVHLSGADSLVVKHADQVLTRSSPQHGDACAVRHHIGLEPPALHVAEDDQAALPVRAAYARIEGTIKGDDVWLGTSPAHLVEQAKGGVRLRGGAQRVDRGVDGGGIGRQALPPHRTKDVHGLRPLASRRAGAGQGTVRADVGLEASLLQPPLQTESPAPLRPLVARSHGRAVRDDVRNKAVPLGLTELLERAFPTATGRVGSHGGIVRDDVRFELRLPHPRQTPQRLQPITGSQPGTDKCVPGHHVWLDADVLHGLHQTACFLRPPTLLTCAYGRAEGNHVGLDVLFQHVLQQVEHDGQVLAMRARADGSAVGDDAGLYGVQLHLLEHRQCMHPLPALSAGKDRCIVRDGVHLQASSLCTLQHRQGLLPVPASTASGDHGVEGDQVRRRPHSLHLL